MRAHNASYLSYNCCPPYTGCLATVKMGIDPAASLPAGDACQRRCEAKLGHSFYRLELRHHTPLCSGVPPAAAPSAAARSNRSSLALVGDYLRVRNVAIDFSRTACPRHYGRERVFNKGFLRAACNARMTRLPPHLHRLPSIMTGVAMGPKLPQACHARPRTDEERRFTVFVARTDMGNYAHALGDFLSVFQLFDHLKLRPSDAQVVLLDTRIMCYGKPTPDRSNECDLDCTGPFTRLWAALSGGAPVVRAKSWAGRGPMCFREAAFSTHWSEVGKLAWAPPSQCVGSSILHRYRRVVMAQMGVLDVFPPSGKLRLLYSRRGSFSAMGKRSVRRHITNEDKLLGRIRERYPDALVVERDFGRLPLVEQMREARQARLLFGMHGAGFMNLLWLPTEAVVLEMFGYGGMVTPVHRNLAKFRGAIYLSWENPHRHLTTPPSDGENTHVHWPSFRRTFNAAIRAARNFGRAFSSGGEVEVAEGVFNASMDAPS